jgi:hypothetical protein
MVVVQQPDVEGGFAKHSTGKRIGGARSKGGNQETEMDPLVVVLMIVVVLATWAGLAVWLWRSEHRRQRNTRDRQP